MAIRLNYNSVIQTKKKIKNNYSVRLRERQPTMVRTRKYFYENGKRKDPHRCFDRFFELTRMRQSKSRERITKKYSETTRVHNTRRQLSAFERERMKCPLA